MLPEHVVFGIDEAKRLIKNGYPVKIKTENVGNPWLKKVARKNKVKFLICSHIHESGGKACDSKGKPVKQGNQICRIVLNRIVGVVALALVWPSVSPAVRNGMISIVGKWLQLEPPRAVVGISSVDKDDCCVRPAPPLNVRKPHAIYFCALKVVG
jgi:hypothetical protein